MNDEKIPPSRYPGRPIDQAAFRWWIAKVKPRQEKQLAFDFIDHGVEYYLPIYKKVTCRPGTNKKRVFEVPLFPGYICFAQDVPQKIFVTGRVVNLIEVKNQKKFVCEISAIYNALEHGICVEPLDDTFTIESQVEVVSGPLKGVCGVVVSIRNSRQLVVEVDSLGSAAVQINMGDVRVVGSCMETVVSSK
jgi:transcription antitermination factor NusG